MQAAQPSMVEIRAHGKYQLFNHGCGLCGAVVAGKTFSGSPHRCPDLRLTDFADHHVDLIELGSAQAEAEAVPLGERRASNMIVHPRVLVGHEDRGQAEGDDVMKGVVAGRRDGEVESGKVASERVTLDLAHI